MLQVQTQREAQASQRFVAPVTVLFYKQIFTHLVNPGKHLK